MGCGVEKVWPVLSLLKTTKLGKSREGDDLGQSGLEEREGKR